MKGPGDEKTAITQLLIAWSDGRREALDDLMPLVYADLRRLAAGYMMREAVDHPLQPTALVHEAYLRLVDQDRVKWRNRAHFFGVAATMMRRILIEQARARRAEKRGGHWQRVTLVGEGAAAEGPAEIDVLALSTSSDDQRPNLRKDGLEIFFDSNRSCPPVRAVLEGLISTCREAGR